MAVETAIILAPIATMFFISWVGFKLVDNGRSTHEAIGLFLLLMGFLQTIIVANIVRAYATDNALSAAVKNTLSQNYFAAIIIFVIVMIYFVLRVMVIPMLMANKRKSLGMKE